MPKTHRAALIASLLAAAAPAWAEGPAASAAGAADPSGEWRGARWGMTVEEVAKALGGEAKPMQPVLKLADGAVVALEAAGQDLVGQVVHARFVFTGGKLSIVSLRSPSEQFVPADTYEKVRKVLAGRFGTPGASTSDDNFIDMRQTTWTLARGTADLKYIPGVLVLQYHPTEVTAARAAASDKPVLIGGPDVLDALRKPATEAVAPASPK